MLLHLSIFLALFCSSNVILEQTIHGESTPAPFVTNAALDELKESIQELRSILLRGRGGPYEEPYFGMDNRNRRSRQSGDFGPPFETTNNGPIIIPPSSPMAEHPPPGPILWQPNPGEHRPRQVVRMQSSPVIIQAARSRSPSRDRYNINTVVDMGISQTNAQELESVIDDFSSIVIIVGVFFLKPHFSYLTSRYRFQGHLPRLGIHRDARTRA